MNSLQNRWISADSLVQVSTELARVTSNTFKVGVPLVSPSIVHYGKDPLNGTQAPSRLLGCLGAPQKKITYFFFNSSSVNNT